MPPRILVADDDPSIRGLLAVTLGEHFDVELVEDGDAAAAALLDPEAGWACAVLDVMMPGRTGLDVLALVRADPHVGALPVVVLTARITEQESLASGADAHVAKPFDPQLLTSTIELLLAGAAGGRQVERLERLAASTDPVDPDGRDDQR